MKKYRVTCRPIVVDVYAESERDAMDTVWSYIDSLEWDDYNIDSVGEYVGADEDFYPLNEVGE